MNEYAAVIDRINGNVASTYTALAEMGATMPETQNSDNLPGTVRTVPQGGGTSVQTDWNQMDETAPDFLKNKPFCDFPTVVLEEQEVPFDAETGGMMAIPTQPINDGDRMIITYDGVEYKLNAAFNSLMAVIAFGNLAMAGVGDDTGEPFVGICADGMVMFLGTDEASHTVKIVVIAVVVLPDKYTNIPKLFCKSFTDGEYLYTDVMCTTKAKHEDVPNHVEFSLAMATGGFANKWIKPQSVMSSMWASNAGYNVVTIVHGVNVIQLYTAEYTP